MGAVLALELVVHMLGNSFVTPANCMHARANHATKVAD